MIYKIIGYFTASLATIYFMLFKAKKKGREEVKQEMNDNALKVVKDSQKAKNELRNTSRENIEKKMQKYIRK